MSQMTIQRQPPTADDVRRLVAGDQVRMPCHPDKWDTVTAVRDFGSEGHVCFVIDCVGGVGHGGEMPLEIKKSAGANQPASEGMVTK